MKFCKKILVPKKIINLKLGQNGFCSQFYALQKKINLIMSELSEQKTL